MPKTCLGIRFIPQESSAVLIRGGLKGGRVETVVTIPLSEDGSPVEAVPQADTVVTGLPGDSTFCRIVELPFTDKRRIEQAAPLEAEETLPLPLEKLICHVHPLGKSADGSRSLLVAAPREKVAAAEKMHRSAGVDPAVLDVEPLALYSVVSRVGDQDSTRVVLELSEHLAQAVCCSGEGPLGFVALSAVSPDSRLMELKQWIGSLSADGIEPSTVYLCGEQANQMDLTGWTERLGVETTILPLVRESLSVPADLVASWPAWALPLGLALREIEPASSSRINLLRQEFAKESLTDTWRGPAIKTAVYAAILLVLWSSSIWMELSFKSNRVEELDLAIRRAFAKTLPDVTSTAPPVDLMRQKVGELENKSASLGSLVDRDRSPLRLLREISSRIPKTLKVELREISFEEERVKLEGVAGSFDAIDRIKESLLGYERFSEVEVSDAKAGMKKDEVIFKMTAFLGRKE